MNRRQFGISASSLAVGAAMLAGCHGLTSATIPNEVVADLGLIKNGLSVVLGAASAMGLNASTAATITNYASTAIALISTVAVGMAQSAGQTIVTQVQADLTALVSAIKGAGITLPPMVLQVVDAIVTLAPAIYAAVGILVTAPSTPAPEALGIARQTLGAV